jgi:hypothetical protein
MAADAEMKKRLERKLLSPPQAGRNFFGAVIKKESRGPKGNDNARLRSVRPGLCSVSSPVVRVARHLAAVCDLAALAVESPEKPPRIRQPRGERNLIRLERILVFEVALVAQTAGAGDEHRAAVRSFNPDAFGSTQEQPRGKRHNRSSITPAPDVQRRDRWALLMSLAINNDKRRTSRHSGTSFADVVSCSSAS